MTCHSPVLLVTGCQQLPARSVVPFSAVEGKSDPYWWFCSCYLGLTECWLRTRQDTGLEVGNVASWVAQLLLLEASAPSPPPKCCAL